MDRLSVLRYLHLDMGKQTQHSVAGFRFHSHALIPMRLFVCSLRRKYSFLLFPFCQSFSMEAPFSPHALPSQTVFDFLSQQHNRLLMGVALKK